MYYSKVVDNNNTRTMIDAFRGYNHNYKIGQGEFFDMENLTTDLYPLMSARKIRKIVAPANDEFDQPQIANMRGVLLTDSNLAYLDGCTLHYGLKEYDISDLLEDDMSWQTMIRFGAYILFFPACIYINVENEVGGTDKGIWGAEYKSANDVTITFTICNSEGNGFSNITASDTSPENPVKEQYWMCTKTDSQGLYIWQNDSWMPIATSYIRIDVPGANLTNYFKEGDCVHMNTIIKDINNGSQIISMSDESLVVIGMMNEVVKTSNRGIDIQRKIPKLDYICSSNNRIWGCHYGFSGTDMVNEIYCSKLGDFKNWYQYVGLASDSYAVTVGIPGSWTGCINYQGYPTFFKENAIYRIFGSAPSSYQVNQINARGVQYGSDKSLVVVDERLVYKSPTDVCVFDGSTPTSISEALGTDTLYYDAIAGGCQSKYRVEMETDKAVRQSFVFDFKTGLWTKEDKIGARQFTEAENGQIFAATDIQVISLEGKYFYSDDIIGEEYVEWFAETGEMGYETVDFKYVSRITLRAYVPDRSEISIFVSYDDRPFEKVAIMRGADDVGTQSTGFNPFRCDHFKLRIEGHGDIRIYNMSITYDTGSEENGYKY